jgi:hypothetical protein
VSCSSNGLERQSQLLSLPSQISGIVSSYSAWGLLYLQEVSGGKGVAVPLPNKELSSQAQPAINNIMGSQQLALNTIPISI